MKRACGFATAVLILTLAAVPARADQCILDDLIVDGSACIWDVVGNETNFFVRDVTNGSTLPLRIRPGASSNSLFIDTDDDIGIGTSAPDGSVDVRRTGGDADIRIDSASGGSARFRLVTGATVWNTTNSSVDGDYELNVNDGVGVEAQLAANGNLTLEGEIITGNCPAGCGPADFVFEPDYELMPLAERLAALEAPAAR